MKLKLPKWPRQVQACLFFSGVIAFTFGLLDSPLTVVLMNTGRNEAIPFTMAAFWLPAVVLGYTTNGILYKLGVKRTYSLAFLAATMASLGYGVFANHPYLMEVVRIFHGFSYGVGLAISSVVIREVLPPKRALSTIAWEQSVTATALGLGTVGGTWLVSYKIPLPIWGGIPAVLSMLCVLMAWGILSKFEIDTAKLRPPIKRRLQLDVPSLKVTLWGMGTSVTNRIYQSYLSASIGLGLGGVVLFVSTMFNAIIGPIFAKLIEKHGHHDMVIVISRSLMFGAMLAIALYTQVSNVWLLFIAAAAVAIAVKGHNLGTDQKSVEISENEMAARTSFKNSQNLAFLIGTYYGGTIGNHLNYSSSWFWICTGIPALIALIAGKWMWIRSHHR